MRRICMVTALVLGVVGAAVAHGGQKHVLGKVVAVGEDSITVETTGKEAKKVAIVVTGETKFQKSGSGAAVKDLTVGERVVVHAKENKEKKLEAVLVIFGNPDQHKKP